MDKDRRGSQILALIVGAIFIGIGAIAYGVFGEPLGQGPLAFGSVTVGTVSAWMLRTSNWWYEHVTLPRWKNKWRRKGYLG